MKKIYLHLGLHKTGTSSFQETCRVNVKALEGQGYTYPLFDNVNGVQKIANHSIPIYSIFCSNPENYHMNTGMTQKSIEATNLDYRNQLERFMTSENDVILSGEDMSMLSAINIKKLKSFLDGFGLVIPIVVIRSPYRFHCSNTQESIKHGFYQDLSKFNSQIKKLETIIDVFPDAKFMAFDATCRSPSGPIGHLFEFIGVQHELFTFTNSNEGVSNTKTRLQNVINQLEPKIKAGQLNGQWMAIDVLTSEFCNQKFYLTEKEFSDIKPQFVEDNTFFLQTFGEEFVDSEVQFTSRNETYEEIIKIFQNADSLNDCFAPFLINAAQDLEFEDLNLAFRLMQLAHEIRPQGPFIKDKLLEYQARLEKSYGKP